MMFCRPWRTLGILGLAVLALPLAAAAQTGAWTPPAPAGDSRDWIGLVSGEWLGGEIKHLRNGKLELTSEGLETITIDWEKVRELRSPKVYTYAFSGRVIVAGTAAMHDSTVVVRGVDWMRTFPRSGLLSIVPGGAREVDLWSAIAHLGLVLRSGNTDQSDLTTVVRARRAGALTRLAADYTGNFGSIDGKQNVNNHNGNAKLDAFVSNRFYLTPLGINVFSDRFQNIDLRVSPSLGIGARIVETRTLRLEAEFGAGYQWTWFRSVQAGQPSRTDQGTLIPALVGDLEATDDIRFDLEYKVNIGVPEAKDSFHHLVGILSYDLTDAWNFEVAMGWDRVENPRPGTGGAVPQRDDFRTSFGVGVEF